MLKIAVLGVEAAIKSAPEGRSVNTKELA